MCGLKATEAPVTIFVHVMGMFLPAFFTGHLIARFGVFNMMMVGHRAAGGWAWSSP